MKTANDSVYDLLHTVGYSTDGDVLDNMWADMQLKVPGCQTMTMWLRNQQDDIEIDEADSIAFEHV